MEASGPWQRRRDGVAVTAAPTSEGESRTWRGLARSGRVVGPREGDGSLFDTGLFALTSINLGGSCHCEWASARLSSLARHRTRLPTCPPHSRRLRAAPRSPRRRPHAAPRSAACTAPTRTTRHARCQARPQPPGMFVGRARSHRHRRPCRRRRRRRRRRTASEWQCARSRAVFGSLSLFVCFLVVLRCGGVCVVRFLAQIERKHSGDSRASPRRNPTDQCGNRAGQRGNPAGQRRNSAGQRGNSAGQRGNSAGQRGNSAGQRGNSAEPARKRSSAT